MLTPIHHDAAISCGVLAQEHPNDARDNSTVSTLPERSPCDLPFARTAATPHPPLTPPCGEGLSPVLPFFLSHRPYAHIGRIAHGAEPRESSCPEGVSCGAALVPSPHLGLPPLGSRWALHAPLERSRCSFRRSHDHLD